jgi:hypothetical protein
MKDSTVAIAGSFKLWLIVGGENFFNMYPGTQMRNIGKKLRRTHAAP